MTKPCSLLSWWTMDAATGLWPGFPFFPFWGDTEQLKINLAGIWELAGRNPTAFRPVALNHLSWPDPGSFSQLPPLLAFPAAILISDFPSTGREEGAPGPPAQTCGRCCSPPEVSAAVSFGSLSANLSSCSCLFWLLLTFPPWPQDCQQGWGGVRIGTQLSGVPNCGLPLTPQALLWRGTETRKVTVGIRTGRCAFKMFATLKGLAHKAEQIKVYRRKYLSLPSWLVQNFVEKYWFAILCSVLVSKDSRFNLTGYLPFPYSGLHFIAGPSQSLRGSLESARQQTDKKQRKKDRLPV